VRSQSERGSLFATLQAVHERECLIEAVKLLRSWGEAGIEASAAGLLRALYQRGSDRRSVAEDLFPDG
jgi:hypothetical protein